MCSGNIEDHLKLSEWYPPTTIELLSSGLGTPGKDTRKPGKGGGSSFKKAYSIIVALHQLAQVSEVK